MIAEYEEIILKCSIYFMSSSAILFDADDVISSDVTGYDRQFSKVFRLRKSIDLKLIKHRRIEFQCLVNGLFHPFWVRIPNENLIEIEKWDDENLLPGEAGKADVSISKIEVF